MTDPVSIIAFCLALIVAVTLIILFKKRIIDADVIAGTGQVLDDLPAEGFGPFSVIASYARTAVHAVDQLVKNGIIQRDDKARKDAAMNMVEAAARVDGLSYGAQEMEVADMCIEAEVHEQHNSQKPPDTNE